jgi:hypothetical protein
MPLSTIFQLYLGGQFHWWRKPENPEKASDLSKSLTNFITYILTIENKNKKYGKQLIYLGI